MAIIGMKWERGVDGLVYYSEAVVKTHNSVVSKYIIRKIQTDAGIRYRVHEANGVNTFIWVPNIEVEGYDANRLSFKSLAAAKKAVDFHVNFGKSK